MIVLALLLAATVASADVVGPPADFCPAGSEGQACHSGPFCAPRTCTTDDDCDGGTCRERDLCMDEFDCGGMDTAGEGHPVDEVTGRCGANGTCGEGTCEAVRVCTGAGCGCRAAEPIGAGGLLGALAALLVGRRTRRRGWPGP
jgi:hypothetical protein